jgi:hypothetical protein
MRTQSSDTPPEIEEIPPAQRMAAMRIQAQYGTNLSERELRLRLAALWLHREIMIEAFGWDPEVEGY